MKRGERKGKKHHKLHLLTSLVAFSPFSRLSSQSKRAIELNNGRAAMMGILALMVHEMLNNDPYVINSLLGFPVAFN